MVSILLVAGQILLSVCAMFSLLLIVWLGYKLISDLYKKYDT